MRPVAGLTHGGEQPPRTHETEPTPRHLAPAYTHEVLLEDLLEEIARQDEAGEALFATRSETALLELAACAIRGIRAAREERDSLIAGAEPGGDKP